MIARPWVSGVVGGVGVVLGVGSVCDAGNG